ncbi:2-aminoadipate transaminase [Aureococcus anophagefferens]|nr:2-aminoadipate transaminase [Aureococcus anophagefferens]
MASSTSTTMDELLKRSTVAQSLVRNPIRVVMNRVFADPSILSLAGGRPVASVFPLVGLSLKLKDNSTLTTDLKAFVKAFHGVDVDAKGYDCVVTPGNSDGIFKSVLALSDPGDIIFADAYTYTGILACARPLGRLVVGVDGDDDGMSPDALVEACERARRAGKRCAMLYVIPNGHNPLGLTMPEKRRKELYLACRAGDLAVVEDDSYSLLRLPARGKKDYAGLRGALSLEPSFLAIDALPGFGDGRVVRLDSFSKSLCPGLRFGFLTAPKPLVEKLGTLNEVTTWSLSGVALKAYEILLNDLAKKNYAKMEKQARDVQRLYATRRDLLLDALDKILKPHATYNAPKSGMFLLVRAADPDVDVAALLDDPGRGVALPAAGFRPDGGPSNAFRVSFTQVHSREVAERAATKLKVVLSDAAKVAAAKGWRGAPGARVDALFAAGGPPWPCPCPTSSPEFPCSWPSSCAASERA